MSPRQPARDMETQTVPIRSFVMAGALSSLEDQLTMGTMDTGALIVDVHDDVMTLARDVHLDRRSVAVSMRVRHEGVNDLRDVCRLPEGVQIIRDGPGHRPARGRRNREQGLDRVAHGEHRTVGRVMRFDESTEALQFGDERAREHLLRFVGVR